MATSKQLLGDKGEKLVVKRCSCPRCKRARTLRQLPPNFKCADVICDFCGYLAQVKTISVKDVAKLPPSILGAAWRVQKERMDAGIYFPLFLVLIAGSKKSIFYLAADLQTPTLFSPRKPLSKNARRAGWRGFIYVLSAISEGAFVRLL